MDSNKSAWIIGGAIIVGALIVSYPHQRAWSGAFSREVAVRAACEQIIREPENANERSAAERRLRVENCLGTTLNGR